MKRTIYMVCMIALLSAIMMIPASATTWDVHNGDSINDYTGYWGSYWSKVAPGDTIFVYNGTYEQFNIDKPNLKVIGEGADVVIVDCGNGNDIRMPDSNGNATGSVLDGVRVVNSPVGLYLGEFGPAPDCIIRNCVFEGMTASYMTIKGDNTTFENCIFKDFTLPSVRIEGENCTIESNLFVNCTSKYGPLYLKTASYSTVANNTFIDNAPSPSPTRIITLRESSNCMVINNTIVNNSPNGMQIREASNNIITQNNITSNGGIINLKDAGSGNKIYLNNFVNNPGGVTYYGTPPSTTYWNSTSPIEYTYNDTTYTNYLGNYWSDYTGVDTSPEDGIGDTSYGIPPDSPVDNDYRPLMTGFENYQAPAAPAEWNLTLNGAIAEVMNQSTFEGGVACHNVSWTDSKDRTWTGMPLWKLVGWVDDDDKHNFNDELANRGYNVTVIAGDGYSKTFNSTFVKRNENIFVANELNGTAIPGDSSSYPLKFTGSDLKKSENVKNVVEIRLNFPPPPSASLTASANVKITMVGISLNRTEIDYGNMRAGQNSDNEAVDITNIGTSDVDVTLEINGTTAVAQSFYEQSLYVDDNLYNPATVIAQIPTSNSEDVVTQLRVPLDWSEVGTQDATFVFWAEA